ncbi:MAG: winged helix-turn-helix transcriptional regulator [Chloroflexi bacterium]|nr:winged helix-turn-helix transcriptional regulator [Chloroflexota bacterium]
MIEILQNKNSATKFQILVEIAAAGPSVHQRTIAAKVGVTPQAISDYIRQLTSEEMVISTGHSSYRVSAKGVNWVLEMLRELNEYVALVSHSVTNITVCAAIAEADLKKGQPVGLKMKDGLLFAVLQTGKGAKGVVLSTAKQGEDVDVSNIEGIVELTRGKVSVLQVPSIVKGGSRMVEMKKLRARVNDTQPIGTIGIEALVALRQIMIEPQYIYGVIEAALEAVHCGLNFTVVCTEDATPELIKRLEEEKVEYEIVDLSKKKTRTVIQS